MQFTLFHNTTMQAFTQKHKGLRGATLRAIENFYNKRNRMPVSAKRGHRGSANDRETLLAENVDILQQWKINSQRATYSWLIKNLNSKSFF